MGGVASWVRSFSGAQEQRILMVGLDAAGKTTMIYKMKLGEVITTIPTIGFNVETMEYKNINFTVWDVGGEDKIRPLWRHYYPNTTQIILVVDSNDRERLGEARDEIHKMLGAAELRKLPLLVFANKQDLPNSMSASEIEKEMQLEAQREFRPIKVQPCCATTFEGVPEGLEWLGNDPQVIINPQRFKTTKSARSAQQ